MMHKPKSNILLIDDEALVLEMFAYILRGAGFRVKTAISAEEGLLIFSQSRIDILVSDVNLGGADGYEVASKLRRKVPFLPVVLITGKPDFDGRERARRAGYSYLSKPVEMRHLVTAVQRGLAPARTRFVSPMLVQA